MIVDDDHDEKFESLSTFSFSLTPRCMPRTLWRRLKVIVGKNMFHFNHVHVDPHRIDINHNLSRPAVSGEVLQDHPKGKKPLVFMLTRKMQIICTTIMLDCLLGLIFLSSKSSMGF